MSSRSRSRSHSGSRSPARKRNQGRNIRDESISPIRTASGANLRFTKARGGQNQFRGNRGYHQNFQQRNYNYNNRNYFQRNNYGNRWNRGRGNYRGNWNYNYNNRNNWNNNQRQRYNSRSDHSRSRSRSRSKSYDRNRSRSRSYSRSRSRGRSRSRSYDRRRRTSHSSNSSVKSRSRSPPRAEEGQEKQREPSPQKAVNPTPMPAAAMSFQSEMESKPPQSDPASLRSRWETPEPSPNRDGNYRNEGQNVALQDDEIFEKWDDDKLRAYLLKTNAKKIAREGRTVPDMQTQTLFPLQQESSGKKKKNKAGDAASGRGRKKKKVVPQTRSSSDSSSSSSSSWSPIHKAPERTQNKSVEPPKAKISPPKTQEFEPMTSSIYAQQTVYSSSAERTQAVQYPFSHLSKPTPVPQPTPAPPPKPVAQPGPAVIPGLGELQIIGPDGTPIKLVQMMVPGPDGKMMQVMQVQQVNPAPVSQPAVVSEASNPPQQVYRTPPPPPSYPPPTQNPLGKYVSKSPMPPATTMATSQPRSSQKVYPQPATMRNFPPEEGQSLHRAPKVAENVGKDDLYRVDQTPDLKKVEKQKRRQEVLRTRFKPAPASSNWGPDSQLGNRDSTNHTSQKMSQENQEEKSIQGFSMMKMEQGSPRIKANVDTSYGIPTVSLKTQMKRNSPVVTHSKREMRPDQGQERQNFPEIERKIPTISQGVPPINPEPKTEPPNQPTNVTVPPQLAAQGFRAMYGNPQILVGPNGEMLQLIATPAAVGQEPAPTGSTRTEGAKPPKVAEENVSKKPDGWTAAAEEFIRGKPERQDETTSDSSSSEDEAVGKATIRKRTISEESEAKKSKKKSRVAIVTEDFEETVMVKRKKDMKKKKKKNKKKKEEQNDNPEEKKEKKKKKKQKEKIESVENETLKSKKDWKGFNEANKRSKPDNLIRAIAPDLPLSHIRAILPRNKGEGSNPLLVHINFDFRVKSALTTATSYEDRFVSLFGSGEAEPAPVVEERIDITKKSVLKFKVQVKGTRAVCHMTKMSLSDRFKQLYDENETAQTSQKVSLNMSSLEKPSKSKKKSQSRSRTRSSSESSQSQEERPRRHYRSRSKSQSKSRSRSLSLPLAYSVDDKPNRHEGDHGGQGKNYPGPDLREDIERQRKADYGSRSRSRSVSSNEEHDKNRQYQQRQPYYNNNYNRNYNPRGYYNNRGYNNNNNRGYYNRGRWSYNHYQNRGNYNNRGRYQNWNHQGYNRNYQRYQRYDNRDDRHNRSGDKYDYSPDRSHNQERRSPSKEREDQRDSKQMENSPSLSKKEVIQKETDSGTTPQNTGKAEAAQKRRQPSPAQWSHDMFEETEEKDD